MLDIQADPDCVQGSLVSAPDATETWIRPLHDGSFAVVLLNKGQAAATITTGMTQDYAWGAFYPAAFPAATIRDAGDCKDLGHFTSNFTFEVAPLDARILRVTPTA